jgi:hypothetical protein
MTGEFAEGGSPSAAFRKGVVIFLSIPVCAFSALMMFMGIRSMVDPHWVGDLSVCLWAGLAILGAWSLYLVYVLCIMPRRTISSFVLSDDDFTCTTRRDGTRAYPLSTLKSIQVLAGRRRGGKCPIYGWLIRFEGGKPLQIDSEMPNADKLATELQSRR